MESGNGGASSKGGVFLPLSATSDVFRSNVLAPLKSAYLYEESKQLFSYESAALINNPALEKKYKDFRAKRRELGYSEEELKESYGFLLFDDVDKANALGETGVLTGNSTCTALGDPSNGVYISVFSDCLDLNRWYHEKSGYIAIIRLTKGRVKKVSENYTQNFTPPTEGFDCHVSEELHSVSAKTSSFVAFERAQYYMYELLNDGSSETARSPSAACPFAIVSFTYKDTKGCQTPVTPHEKSGEKKLVYHYFPWRGQLQIGTLLYAVGLRSTAGASIPAELPPVVKIHGAISMLELRQLLPRAVFETCFSGEVFLDGFYCSLYEFVSSETEQTNSLSQLLWEIKEKDVALTIPLNDGGFLILLPSSHFLTYDDTGSSAAEVLQGMFVFSDSRVIHGDIKLGQRNPAISSEILRALPVLSYAEGEVEKTPTDPNEELSEVFVQHMQSYAALINPGLALSPSRDTSIFPDQYDVPDADKHLYLLPEWTDRAWQNFRSYLSKPVSFELPVSKASEILAAGQEERIEDLDDGAYICLSSPEDAPASHVGVESEDQLTGQEAAVNVEATLDHCITSVEAQVDITAVPQNIAPVDLRPGDVTKDTEKSELTVLIKTDDIGTRNLLTTCTADNLPTEMIVSITSAERTVTDGSLSVIGTESATKHIDFKLSGFPAARLQMAGLNSMSDETDKTKQVFNCPEVANLSKTKHRKLHRGHSKGQKHAPKVCVETPVPVEDDDLSLKEDQSKVSTGHPQLSNPSNTDWRKARRRKRKFGTLSSKNKKVRSATVGLPVTEEKKADPGQQNFESTILMELGACPLRKKTERWDLKPVISECGRILVPHGSIDIADQIKNLKVKLPLTKDEPCPEKLLVDATMNAHDTVEMQQESSTAPETTVDEPGVTTSEGEGSHPQNVSNVNHEHIILRPSDGNGSLTLNPESTEHSSKDDGTDTPPLKTFQEKHMDTPSPRNCATKGEFLLNKLKSVLLRGNRKTGTLGSEKMTADTAPNTEPCLKKAKVDSDFGMLKTDDAVNFLQDTSLGVKEVSNMLSVDPLFAHALGLTPKETGDKIQKSEGQDTQQRKDSSETEEKNSLDKQPQITQRPLSIFPRRGRIKTLKKHQGISAEYVKRNWWLHFQTPACLASEKLKYKECTRDKSVRKTVKEKSNSACSSTDALNLLADLALSANNDQVLPQPDPALQRKPEPSLKNCDLTKDVTTVEQESVLHALLRQPATRPIQPLESPSPSHLVGGSELVGLIAKEHAYSFHPSSSLLLDLSGTPFQVPPLSGSTRLLHHHQTMSGGTKTPHPSVIQEDRREQNHRTPEYLKKRNVCSRKFRRSRTFVNKDGSVQVTKQCKENYDFNLDSKFTSDSKDRAIIRGLHGPWDFSIQDTSEEVQLIVHMWIGLFYSRSTARFFHVDSDCTNPSPEESDSLEMSTGMIPAPAQSELKANSSAPCLNVTDTSDKALDLSKKDDFVLDQGSVILDLSQRNSNAEIVTSGSQVNRKETSVSGEQKGTSDTLKTLKSLVELQTASPFQCYRNGVDCTEIVSEVDDVRSTYESKRTCTPLEKAGPPEHTDVPSFKDFISVQEEMQSVSLQLESPQTASDMCRVSHECNNEKTDMKGGVDHSEATEMKFMQKQRRDSNKKAANVVHTIEHDESESQNGENWKLKEYQEGHMDFSPKDFHTDDNSTNEESRVVCNGNLVDSVTQVSREEPKAVSPDMAEHVNDDMDCCAVRDDEVIKDYHFGKEDGRDEKDCYISHVEADSDLNDQPLPILCDDPDSVKRDSNTECNGQAPLDEQPSQANNDACHDLQLRKLSANGCALTDEHSISETVPHASFKMEPIHKDPAVEGNSENSIFGADLSNQPLLTYDGPESVKKDGITECNLQAPLDEQPCQADNKEDACCDLQLRNVDASGSGVTDDRAFPETATHLSLEMDPTYNEPVIEENSENDICLADKAHYQKAALDGSSADGSVPQTNDSVETGSQNKVMSNFSLRSDEREDRDTRSIEGEQNVEITSQEELLYHQSHSPLFETVTRCESEMTLTKGVDIKSDETNKGLEKIHGTVVIPFIGIDPSGEATVQARDSHSQGKVEEVQGQKEILSSETTYPEIVLPTEVCSTSPVCDKKAELSASTVSLSLFDVNEAKQPEISGSESDDRSPTPTMDEEPYQYVTCSAPISSTSSSTFKDSETLKNMTKPCLSRSSVLTKEEMPLERKHKPTVYSVPNPHHGLHPDLELRTLRVLQSIDKLLSKSSHNDTSSLMKTADTKRFLDQTDKLQETSIGQDCHLHRLFPSTECLQVIKSNIDQDNHKSAKNDEIHTDCISNDRVIENSVLSDLSKNKQTTSPVITYNKPASMLLEKKTESLKGISGGLNYDKQEASELSPKSTWLSSVGDSTCNSSKATFACQDSLYQYKETDVSKSNKIPASLPIQSFESTKNKVDGSHSLLTNSLVEKVGRTTKEIIEMDQTDCSNTSTSVGDYKDDSMIDDRPFREPQSSLTCTVYNVSQKRSESFLEQISKRCLQDDLTQASMEQECLIFSEQMKQLLKRSKRGPIHQLDARDNLNLSCSSPVTVRFSSLEEQDDSVDHLDMLSLVGQKIKVDMFDRKDLTDTTEEESSLHLQKLPQRNPLEHAGVSSVTAECARLYTAMMNDVCDVKKVPSRPKHSRRELLSYSSYYKSAPSNHTDFCDHMMKEEDESNLNSAVKKSCTTKYRFYILVTSDDTFFEETKAQLEAEGHTAVQPSEFFLNEESSSSLFIILRNEDIAQRICEVPHLLELKKSAGVQFAGIDEPDDIVNLTHQELFMRGGFVMVDRAAQESLSLCNMKEMSKILQELSREGKWKWMLHYRDIRRLKENARLSADAKEKRNFFNWCQEVGILEVLPYHKCDLMSRDQPDYLTCLVHLQVQNISARYHIFITDTTADDAYGKKGILTMTLNSFLTSSPSKTFSV